MVKELADEIFFVNFTSGLRWLPRLDTSRYHYL
jgi:hypothetical protein